MHTECKCKEFCSQTRLGGEICSADVNTHKGHYNFKADSYLDVSLSLSRCAQKRREGENGPCASSPVTCVSHAFRARLYTKNEAPEKEADFKGCERNNMVVLWRGYLVHIEYRSRASYPGIKCEHDLSLSSYPSLPFSSNASCSRSPR